MAVKTLSELADFYSAVLLPVLRPLEAKRKKLAGGYLKLTLITAVVLLLVFIVFVAGNGRLWWLFLFPGAAGLWVGIDLYGVGRSYTAEFKNSVIAALVGFLDKGLVYNWESHIGLEEYQNSRIFLQRVDRYSGDDLVSGKLDKTRIRFSELHTEYKTQTTDSKGHTETHWHTIFKGLFFIADFNKDFNGCTVVLPDVAEKMLGGFLGGLLQNMNLSRAKLIKLEDPEFEKNFAVYGEDQVTARYILSTSLMERLLAYKKETNKTVYFSFVDSRIYVAVAYNKNLFEPKIFGTILSFEAIKEYFLDLKLAVDLVDELSLNTRIWSKT